jgi:membrane fusion protein, multidrug efflux system
VPTRRTSIAVIVASIVVTGVGAVVAAAAWRTKRSHDAPAAASVTAVDNQELSQPNHLAVPVRVFEVGSSEPLSGAHAFTGIVRSRYQTEVAFRVPGKILTRNVEVGEQVVAGQTLFELDPGDYLLQQKSAQASLAVADAALQRALRDEKRLADLKRVSAVSNADYEQSLSVRDMSIGQKESAEKQLELASNQVAYCQVVAAQNGVVMSIDAEAGQVVADGKRVCLLSQGDEYEAVIDIPENRIPSQSSLAGIDANVTFWSRPDVHVKARLRELSPIADVISRTYQARFTLIDPPSDIKLGMTATVSWATDAELQQLTIPVSAVFQHHGQPAVWLVDAEHGTLSPTAIKVAVFGTEWLTVAEGLVPGQRIVSAGVQKLDEGMKIRVWEQQK